MNYLQYIKHNVWANATLATVLNVQPNEVLDKELVSSFATIRKTVFHIADAQHIWLSRMRGISPVDLPSKALDNSQAIGALHATSSGFEEYVSRKESPFFKEICSYVALDQKTYQEENGNIIMHCMNHSTFHRGQLITMLRQAGLEGEIPSTDLITYLREGQ